jgi:hypothetical protein
VYQPEDPSLVWLAPPSGSGSRGARIHTSCAVVSAPTLDRAFARWCFTAECDKPSVWAAAFSDPATNGRNYADLTIGRAPSGACRDYADGARPTPEILRVHPVNGSTSKNWADV